MSVDDSVSDRFASGEGERLAVALEWIAKFAKANSEEAYDALDRVADIASRALADRGPQPKAEADKPKESGG